MDAEAIELIDTLETELATEHSILSAEAVLAEVRRRFSPAALGGALVGCRLWHHGTNAVYAIRLETGAHDLMLRIAPARWRTEADVRWELDLLSHLARRNVPVAAPIGDPMVLESPEGSRQAVLFTHAPGRPVLAKPEECRTLGAAVARLHEAGDGFASPHLRFALDATHLLDQPLAWIEPFLAHRPEEAGRYREAAERVRPTVASGAWKRGPIHGDLNGENAHLAGDRWTFFDFDCGGHGPWAYDLAVFRWAGDRFGWPEEVWTAFLSGYTSERPLSTEEQEAIPALAVAREIWLVGMHLAAADRWGYGKYGERYWIKAGATLSRLISALPSAPR